MRRRTIQSHLYLLKILGAIALLAMSSHAIVGLGVHYSPNLAGSIDGKDEILLPEDAASADPHLALNRKEASGIMQGFGVKLWVDFLPFVDIEASSNLQFLQYNVEVATQNLTAGGSNSDTSFALEIDPGLPGFGMATPVFGKLATDISVVYPFLKFPPAISLIKFYAGAGITHVLSSPFLDAKIVRTAAENANVSDPNDFATNPEGSAIALTEEVADAIIDEGLQSGIGGHLIAGARLKPPIIPIAIYLNGKYHLGGGLPSSVSSGLTVEMGAGLAF